jgi:lipopolysaccharide biosynthesis glycosyltransferase
MTEAPVERQARATVARPLAGMAVYTMFRGDLQQLLQWCNFHLNAGVDQVYVVLDSPSPELVKSLPSTPHVHWQVVDQQTWNTLYPLGSQNVERKQVDRFRLMARLAASHGHRYLAFVDADELIMLSEPFSDIADRLPEAPAFRLSVMEMWYDAAGSITEPFAATLAVRPPSGLRVDWSRAFGWRAQFLRNGFLGHQAGKSIYRLPLVSGEITVHGPVTRRVVDKCVDLPTTSGGLGHFDCGSLATWNAKWRARLDGGTVATGMDPQRRAQQRLFAHALHKTAEEQEGFFRQFFSLDREAEAFLGTEGIVERVDVRAMISEPLQLSSAQAELARSELVRLPNTAGRVKYQFALVCDKRFVKPTFATMTSVLAQMGDQGSVRFVVLGDGLDADDVSRLRTLEHTAYDVQVIVHDVTADLDRDVGTEDTKRATFGRIYLVDYLPEQRTIYLDGDVLATRGFPELFEIDLGTACLGGASDSAALRLVANPAHVPIHQRTRLMGITNGDPLEYLNGGVLIFDLDNPDFRTLALQARALVVMHGRSLKQRDQDAMNIAFAGRKYRLGSKYNYMTQFYASDRCLDGNLVQLKYESADASLIHFSGKIKPWESPDDEFYNGLYRRMVAEAEKHVGVNCEFYFSNPPRPPRYDWTPDRWAEILGSPPGGPALPEASADITVLDLCDDGAYLRLSSEMYELALAMDLRLAAYAHGKTLFEVPLNRLGPQEAHLSKRVGQGVRKLSFDLPDSLSVCDGIARHVELAVVGPAPDSHEPLVRSIGIVDVLAAGASATPDLLPAADVDGVMQELADGWLTGWYRSRSIRSGEAVSLYIDDDLVARRPPDLRRVVGVHADGRTRGFRFNIAQQLRLGYGRGDGVISVRVSGTNIPLRGGPLTVADVERDVRYDVSRKIWVRAPEKAPTVVERLRRRWSKA